MKTFKNLQKLLALVLVFSLMVGILWTPALGAELGDGTNTGEPSTIGNNGDDNVGGTDGAGLPGGSDNHTETMPNPEDPTSTPDEATPTPEVPTPAPVNEPAGDPEPTGDLGTEPTVIPEADSTPTPPSETETPPADPTEDPDLPGSDPVVSDDPNAGDPPSEPTQEGEIGGGTGDPTLPGETDPQTGSDSEPSSEPSSEPETQNPEPTPTVPSYPWWDGGNDGPTYDGQPTKVSVGTTAFDSLQEAINAAEDGNTITVNEDLDNVSVVASVEGKSLTIDLETHTLNAGTGDVLTLTLGENSTVTIQNGKIDGSLTSAMCRGLVVTGGKTSSLILIELTASRGGHSFQLGQF